MAKIQDGLAQASKIGFIPALTGGWNAREPLPDLQPNECAQLDNFIPGTGGVSLRPGTNPYASGLGASVQSLMQWYGPTGSPKLFGAAGTNIYDVTAGGAVGAAAVSSTLSPYWLSTMFATPGGNFMVATSLGGDPVQNFDGSTWTQPTITGVSATSLWGPRGFANRLFFIELNTLHVWYLGTQAISGAANKLDFGSVGAQKGGKLVAIADWSTQGGVTPNDNFVAITNRGEVFVYQGTDPSSSSTWSLVGKFEIPPPIGYRCIMKAGADLAILTQQGVVPLSSILAMDNAAAGRVAFTDKIAGAFRLAWKSSGTVSGWEMVDYPGGEISIVNVPNADGTTSSQYVMNAKTGSWCRFLNINAICWAMLGDNLFYGRSDGTVYQYDFGLLDGGTSPITGTVIPAFSDFGTPLPKQFLMAQPLYLGALGSNPPIKLNVDYDLTLQSVVQGTIPNSGTAWGSPWGSPWGPVIGPIAQWQGIEGIGRVGSPVLNVSSKTQLTLQQVRLTFTECQDALAA